MGEQVLDRDLPPVRRVVGQVLRDVLLDPELPPLGQHQDGRRRELLGDRSELEHHLGPVGHLKLHIGEAVPLAQHHLPVQHHDRRRPRRVRRVGLGKEVVRVRRDLRF